MVPFPRASQIVKTPPKPARSSRKLDFDTDKANASNEEKVDEKLVSCEDVGTDECDAYESYDRQMTVLSTHEVCGSLVTMSMPKLCLEQTMIKLTYSSVRTQAASHRSVQSYSKLRGHVQLR